MTPEASKQYEIRLLDNARLVHLIFEGFWMASDLEAFKTDLVRSGALAAARNPACRTLIDQRKFPVQSATTIEALSAIFDGTRGRCAIVVNGTLGKLQIQRNVDDPRLQTFAGLEEACAWLKVRPAEL